MGMFGGDDNSDRINMLQEQQINANKAELEAKKQNLFQTRLDIIKGQGAEQWKPVGMNPKAPK